MKWESLVSTQNLKLAWRRINTGRNLQYKRYFRESYLVYESAAEENLKELHRSLVAKAWQPAHATRVHLPKASGLQRPLSLLQIEDQIVLQAIANKFASKLRKKRQSVELELVFSNRLTKGVNSIFFVERWQRTYQTFQKKCADIFGEGCRWAVSFDLAAYYDTISHDLLLSILSPKLGESDVANSIKHWLAIWSADNIGTMTGHGIPQGPLASDFLAEAFFLPIDLRCRRESFRYLRYVDDIRLFGQTENEVREAVIFLEQECRHRGLIPQISKFEVRKLQSAEDAMGALPSITPTAGKEPTDLEMTPAEAQKLLGTAITGNPKKISDKTRFRFLMYRAPQDPKILTTVLKLLPRYPEHIDAFSSYFSNYNRSLRIARAALKYLESGVPYSYVRGELWHILGRLGATEELRQALPMAQQDARKRHQCIALSWGVMHFLIAAERNGITKIGRRLQSEHAISRSLLAPVFRDKDFGQNGIAKRMLKGTLMEQLAIVRELQRRSITIAALGLRQRDLTSPCRSSLKALGVIRRRQPSPKRDYVAERLMSLYGCQKVDLWRKLLGAEYEHALQVLIEAAHRFRGARSEWLSLHDSFSDIMTRQFFSYLASRNLAGHSRTVDRRGNLVKYGVLIAANGPFDKSYPTIAASLRAIHTRRNRLPGSHPYDQKGGAKTKWLTIHEQNRLSVDAKKALDSVIVVVQQNP